MKQIGFFRVKMLIRIWTSFAIFLSVFALKIQAKPVNFSVECADFRRTALKAHELTLSATSFDPSFHNSGKMMKILLCSNWILVFILEPSICPRKSTECCNAEVELQLRTKARNSYMESLRGILAPMRADFGTYLRDLQSKQYFFLIFTGGPKWKLILAPVFLLLFFIVCHCLRMSIFFCTNKPKRGKKTQLQSGQFPFFDSRCDLFTPLGNKLSHLSCREEQNSVKMIISLLFFFLFVHAKANKKRKVRLFKFQEADLQASSCLTRPVFACYLILKEKMHRKVCYCLKIDRSSAIIGH